MKKFIPLFLFVALAQQTTQAAPATTVKSSAFCLFGKNGSFTITNPMIRKKTINKDELTTAVKQCSKSFQLEKTLSNLPYKDDYLKDEVRDTVNSALGK
ncbi:MAG: hypothetical protein BGO07_01460 [Alphaproteobacteria bacterium 40-19]|nr:MAG: hypothetical protein BGO07_01460 [Alphaproteobacteria bacterium 40-19]